MKKIIVMLLLSAVMSACGEGNVSTEKHIRGLQAWARQNAQIEGDAAANTANPQDSVGWWHNAILLSLRDHEKNTGDTTRAGHKKYFEGFLKKNWGAVYRLPVLPEMESPIRKDYKQVLLSLPVSDETKRKLSQMVAILESISSTEEYDQYKLKIAQVERQIQVSQLSERERNLLWITASMLRYSGYYWMQEFNRMPEQNARTSGFLNKLLGAISSIGADVTTAAYHYVKNTRADGIILEASRMSYICGYYTGWYDNAW